MVTGRDANGEARVVELPDHEFFLATLFVPQTLSTPEAPHPLIGAFITAVQTHGPAGGEHRPDAPRPDRRAARAPEGGFGSPVGRGRIPVGSLASRTEAGRPVGPGRPGGTNGGDMITEGPAH